MDEDMKQSEAQEASEASRLQNCQADLAHYKEKYAYLMSDFENHRRREVTETANRIARAQSAIFLDLLPIADNFERAFAEVAGQHVAGQQDDLQKRLSGFELIYKDLLKLLEKKGVTQMTITEDELFDPEFHEALMHVQHEGKNSGQIVAVLQKGYLYKGNVLRPAHVSVAQ